MQVKLLVAEIICATLLGCSSQQKIDSLDPDFFNEFSSHLPNPSRPLDERYLCKGGFYIHSGFTENELNLIHIGMNEWNDRVGFPGLIKESFNKNERCSMKKVDYLIEKGELGNTSMVHSNIGDDDENETALVTFDEYISTYCDEYFGSVDVCYLSIIQHEIGHTLRLAHIPENTFGIMSSVVNAIAWSAEDQKLCENVRVCPRNSLGSNQPSLLSYRR